MDSLAQGLDAIATQERRKKPPPFEALGASPFDEADCIKRYLLSKPPIHYDEADCSRALLLAVANDLKEILCAMESELQGNQEGERETEGGQRRQQAESTQRATTRSAPPSRSTPPSTRRGGRGGRGGIPLKLQAQDRNPNPALPRVPSRGIDSLQRACGYNSKEEAGLGDDNPPLQSIQSIQQPPLFDEVTRLRMEVRRLKRENENWVQFSRDAAGKPIRQ